MSRRMGVRIYMIDEADGVYIGLEVYWGIGYLACDL